MSTVGLFHHEACSLHDTGWGHPEHQGRLRAANQALARALPGLLDRVEPVQGEPLAPERLEQVHEPALVARVRETCERAARTGEILHIDLDTAVSGASWDAALAAAGCAVGAMRAVCEGRFRSAFCLVRPPGHHATPDRSMGFCLFNGVALAARTALSDGWARRVAIVDWDVHHGNGTQDAFYEDPDVFYLSMHQHPFYPGTGMQDETGIGAGRGTTRNLPMPAGLPAERYVEALVDAMDEVAAFGPDLVLVSAGFDAGRDDPIGGFTLEEAHFRSLLLALARKTRASAGGRLVSVLEGGYDPKELGRNVVAHLHALADAAGEHDETMAGARDAPDGTEDDR